MDVNEHEKLSNITLILIRHTLKYHNNTFIAVLHMRVTVGSLVIIMSINRTLK